MKNICNQIGTDNSAANINAILEQSDYKVKEYLDDCYHVFEGKPFTSKLISMNFLMLYCTLLKFIIFFCVFSLFWRRDFSNALLQPFDEESKRWH